VAGEKLRLDGRNLPAAALDSCWLLPPFSGNLLERSAVTVEVGGFAADGLPALH
jgi:hypothetical protein